MSTVVIDGSLAVHLGSGADGVVVVPRALKGRGHRRGAMWAPIRADDVVAALAAAPAALVLARSPLADPGAACLDHVARIMDATRLRLPEPPQAAIWVVRVAALAAAAGDTALERVVSAVCGLAARDHEFDAQAWVAGPPLGPSCLMRLARHVWAPCPSCPGGGLGGAVCVRCGEAIARGPDCRGQVVPFRRVA